MLQAIYQREMTLENSRSSCGTGLNMFKHIGYTRCYSHPWSWSTVTPLDIVSLNNQFAILQPIIYTRAWPTELVPSFEGKPSSSPGSR